MLFLLWTPGSGNWRKHKLIFAFWIFKNFQTEILVPGWIASVHLHCISSKHFNHPSKLSLMVSHCFTILSDRHCIRLVKQPNAPALCWGFCLLLFLCIHSRSVIQLASPIRRSTRYKNTLTSWLARVHYYMLYDQFDCVKCIATACYASEWHFKKAEQQFRSLSHELAKVHSYQQHFLPHHNNMRGRGWP